MAHEEWDYPALSAHRLAKLEEVASMLPVTDMSAALRAEFTTYMEATRIVLQALKDEVG